MKKYIPAFLLPVLVSPLSALAFSITTLTTVTLGSSAIPRKGPTSVNTYFQIFQNVVGWVFVAAMVLGVLILIIAGIIYMTAGGDQAKASKAMKMVMYALIGVAVAALAWALVNVVGAYFIGSRLIAS